MQGNNHLSIYSQHNLGRNIFFRFLLFSIIWSALTGSEAESWIIGFPAIVCAVFLSLKLSPLSHVSLSFVGICSFIPFFIRQSTLSGIDVMRRVLSRRLAVNPGLVSYTTFLPERTARIFFVNTISLLPGTLSADLQGDRVTVHTIDKNLAIWANMQNLELRIALLWRVTPHRGKTL
jgi:multicomponent Na+:H+ antiporter subunit E